MMISKQSLLWGICILVAFAGCRMPDHPYKCCGALFHEEYEQNCDVYARAGSVLSPTFGPDFSGGTTKMKPAKKTDESTAPEPMSDLLDPSKSGTKPPADLDNIMPQEPPEDLPADLTPQKAQPKSLKTPTKKDAATRRDIEARRRAASANRMTQQ